MSKITVAGVRSNVGELLEYSLETKKRNFLETVELVVVGDEAAARAFLRTFNDLEPAELVPVS